MRRTGWSTPAVGLGLLLVLFGARLTHSALQNAFTIDEPNYVGTGLYLWRTGDYDLVRALRFHPPLVYHLASLPLLALDLGGLRPDPRLGHALLKRGDPPPPALRLASRLPFVLLSCWGAALCFLWAREVAGRGAGLLAACLFTCSPSILAHGALVHSDIAIAVLFLQTLYAFWRWTRRPTPARLALCGLSLGLAASAKLTAILLPGILALLLALALWRRFPACLSLPALGPTAPLRRAAWGAGVWLTLHAVAVAVIWLAYGGSFAVAESPDGPVSGVALPAYLRSLAFVASANASGRPVFFLGELSTQGWWYFFPVAFAIKEPVGLLLLVLAALFSLRARRGRLGLFLAPTFAVYLWILVVHVNLPLGYRYALPLLPPLFVFVATQLAPVPRDRRGVAVAIACACMALEGLWLHPHYLAHFNVLVGGPAHGPRLLLDANLDWGQDVTTLARHLAAQGNPPVWLALFAAEDPAAYGVRGRPLPGCRPVQGLLAISASVRGGLYAANDPFASPEPNCYDWLDRFEPVARPGYSIFLYDLHRASGR
jgi:4-amino-4-deoxy-L-arabinose transferase-like glycosyltransferase